VQEFAFAFCSVLDLLNNAERSGLLKSDIGAGEGFFVTAEAKEFSVLACGVRDVLFSFTFRMADYVFGVWLELFWQSVARCLR